jgi:hypothetical protein
MIKILSKILLTVYILLIVLLPNTNNLVLAQSEDELPALESLVVSDDEISKWAGFSNPINATREIDNVCYYDCVKMVWGSSDTMLSLVMIRLKSPEDAQKALQNLWDLYQSFGNVFYLYDKLENNNQWSGYAHFSRNKFQSVASGSQGSVIIFVSHRIIIRYSGGDLDAGFYRNLVESMRNTELQKLQDAGY